MKFVSDRFVCALALISVACGSHGSDGDGRSEVAPGQLQQTLDAEAVCGDGVVVEGEECDDGNGDPDDGCAPTCTWEYRYAFVSSRLYNGNLRGLEGADRKCQRLATAAGLPGTYKAWLTNRHTTPQERFTHSAVPYVTVTGVVIADDFADLADFILDAPFIVTEQGGVPPLDTTGCPGPADNFATFNVWTGSKPYNCGGWTLSEGGEGVWGYPELPDSWAGVCHGGDCDWLAPIYCFQQ